MSKKLLILASICLLPLSACFTFSRKLSIPSLHDKTHLQEQHQTTQEVQNDNLPCPIQVRDAIFTLAPDNETNALYQRRKFLPLFRRKVHYPENAQISFGYQYNELVIPSVITSVNCTTTKIVLLIPPIGVGIGRWYHDRLLHEFQICSSLKTSDNDMVFIAPDLLGCGTACDPRLILEDNGNSNPMKQLPLITVENWSDQLIDLMQNYERSVKSTNVEWSIVSNGGCVPIALEIAKRRVQDKEMLRGGITNLILSATPRVTSLNKPKDEVKIQKSYRTLSGIIGKAFWWYALRNDGDFIQKFSVKNLAAREENLGDEWRPKCVETARAFEGKSRFSTFAFLAGCLNGGNYERFEILKDHNEVKIDVITGGDKRENPAKSIFWDRRKTTEEKEGVINEDHEPVEETSLVSYLNDNGRKVNEMVVGGRRCPAHEDAAQFSMAMIKVLQRTSSI
jgi:hypothetical protein